MHTREFVQALDDAALAQAIAAAAPRVEREAEAELYRRLAPRARLYGLRHLRNSHAAQDLMQLARMNNRTHRKLLIVDGEVSFAGGVGIADNWNGDATSPDHWRDSHHRLQGPAVAQMQAAFVDNWIKTTGTVLQGKEYFPALPAVGDARAQVFTSSPSGGGDSMLLMYLLSITAAVQTIDLSAAYFVPDELTRLSIRAALERGVRVRIIVPGGHIDTEVVRKASRAKWGELLAAGAEIYEFQPTMFHCKMLIVDQLMVSVSSTNSIIDRSGSTTRRT